MLFTFLLKEHSETTRTVFLQYQVHNISVSLHKQAKHSLTGFSALVDMSLAHSAAISSCLEKDKWIILIMDEMHIKENLVYDKHTGMNLQFALNLSKTPFLSIQAD